MLKAKGATTLLMSVVLLVLSTLVVIFATNFAIMQQKTTANLSRNNQAYAAAEAGLDFGIIYLQQNAATILASPQNGYIQAFSNSSITNVTLANNSQYSIVYTNPVPYNYNLIQITSTGKNDDRTSTRVVSVQVQPGSLIPNSIPQTILSKGSVSLRKNSVTTNTSTNNNILSGSTITFSGSAQTVTSSGIYNSLGPDSVQNSASISGMSDSGFFSNIFGTQDTLAVESFAGHYYQNNSSTDYSSKVNGMAGTSIWIDQGSGSTATIGGSFTTLGTALNPVLLIVNGNLNITGSVIFYGYIFVLGSSNTLTIDGTTNTNGAIASAGAVIIGGSAHVNYNSLSLTLLKTQEQVRYVPVPGTWIDI